MDNNYSPESEVISRFNSNDYKLLEKIGEGGFGQVYKAIQLNTRQFVAIKFLTLNTAFDLDKRRRHIERFKRETLFGSQLQHPNIVRLLDKGQCDNDLIYAVFEFIEGKTLHETLAERGALAPLEAAEIMAQVLDALAHAHEQGVIHRDIKPANIMLTRQGAKTHVKILDFGIGAITHEARQLDYKSLTLTQESLGTPSYTAPEQLRGEPPTPKTDLYVWGLVFIECLTGRPAVSGSSLASILHQQLNSSNVPLPAGIAGHPLAALLRRVLHKKTHERAASAKSIYQEFTRLNFSNLVGNLAASTDAAPDNMHDVDTLKETLINTKDGRFVTMTQRKQITVLCVLANVRPVVGQLLDADAMEALHRDQKAQYIDIAVRYGAFHVGTLGDTLLFYFGYPTSSDNDMRLCVRAGLEIISTANKSNSLRRYTQGVISEVSMGLHAGMITSHVDAIPEGATPNFTMQLARRAAHYQILCSDTVRKSLECYIEFERAQLTSAGINNRDEPLYWIKGEREAGAFGFLRANQQQYGFIGRQAELQELSSLFNCDKIKQRQTRYVHVYGEAGIGKSRLLFELRQPLPAVNHIVAQCLPEYKYNALYPVLKLIRHKYSLDTISSAAAVSLLRDKLADFDGVDEKIAAFLLCAWLDLPLPDDEESQQQPPETQKYLLFDVLSRLLLDTADHEFAGRGLCIFEDLHWADPTSIEFVSYFVAHPVFKNSQCLFISTSRQPLPEALHAIDVKNIELARLDAEKTAEFIAAMFDKQNVQQNVFDIIVARTDGIPLFIEELVNMLKQRGLVRRINGVVSFTDPARINEVPSNLRDSLQQKLDDLSYAKETAQLAAAIGREFDYSLLVAASDQSEEQVQMCINELLATQLVFVQRNVEGDSYVFKHALVRDAAYESMPSASLKHAHLRIAVTLENFSAHGQEQNSSLLAMHWSAAEKMDKAVDYGLHAAGVALKRSAAKDAIHEGARVEEWIEQLEQSEQRRPKKEVYRIMTSAYMESDGWASEKVHEYAEKSKQLLQNEDEINDLIPSLWWEVIGGIVGGSNEGLAEACAGLKTQREHVNSVNKAAIDCALGFYTFAVGQAASYPATILLLESSIKNYDGEPFDVAEHQQLFGFDVKVFSMALLGRVYGFADNRSRAETCVIDALAYARETENSPSIGIALMYCAELYQQYQDKEKVRFYSHELTSFANKHEQPIYESYGQMLLDWAQRTFTYETASYEKLFTEGSMFSLGQYQSYYAETRAANGDYIGALEKINFCINLDRSAGYGFFLPYLYYLKVQYMLHLDRSDEEINNINEHAGQFAERQEAWFFVNKLKQIKNSEMVLL